MSFSLQELLRNSPSSISSGVRRLDGYLPQGGYVPGIYDISAANSPLGLGVYELLFQSMLNILENGGKILMVESFAGKIPWMKLNNNERFQKNRDGYSRLIKSIQVDSLKDVIVLFERGLLLEDVDMVVIDAFTNLYSREMHGIHESGGDKDCIVRFYQGVRCLFAMIQNQCQNGMLVFTIGGMGEFNQKIFVNEEEEEEREGEEVGQVRHINQQILVPTISLKSDINMYYNARIIIYRDWVQENGDYGLVSGLDESNVRVFEDAVRMLNEGRMRCLPHYLCIVPYQEVGIKGGFFLIDNKFQVIDIDSTSGNEEYEQDIVIPDSQSG